MYITYILYIYLALWPIVVGVSSHILMKIPHPEDFSYLHNPKWGITVKWEFLTTYTGKNGSFGMLSRNNKVNFQATLFDCFTLSVLIRFVSGRYNLCCVLIGLLPWFDQAHILPLEIAWLPRDFSSEFSIVKTTCSRFLKELWPIQLYWWIRSICEFILLCPFNKFSDSLL